MSKATIVVIIPELPDLLPLHLRGKINFLLWWSYNVIQTDNVEEGLALIKEHQPHVVIIWNEGKRDKLYIEEINKPVENYCREHLIGLLPIGWCSPPPFMDLHVHYVQEWISLPFDFETVEPTVKNVIERVNYARKQHDENQSSS